MKNAKEKSMATSLLQKMLDDKNRIIAERKKNPDAASVNGIKILDAVPMRTPA